MSDFEPKNLLNDDNGNITKGYENSIDFSRKNTPVKSSGQELKDIGLSYNSPSSTFSQNSHNTGNGSSTPDLSSNSVSAKNTFNGITKPESSFEVDSNRNPLESESFGRNVHHSGNATGITNGNPLGANVNPSTLAGSKGESLGKFSATNDNGLLSNAKGAVSSPFSSSMDGHSGFSVGNNSATSSSFAVEQFNAKSQLDKIMGIGDSSDSSSFKVTSSHSDSLAQKAKVSSDFSGATHDSNIAQVIGKEGYASYSGNAAIDLDMQINELNKYLESNGIKTSGLSSKQVESLIKQNNTSSLVRGNIGGSKSNVNAALQELSEKLKLRETTPSLSLNGQQSSSLGSQSGSVGSTILSQSSNQPGSLANVQGNTSLLKTMTGVSIKGDMGKIAVDKSAISSSLNKKGVEVFFKNTKIKNIQIGNAKASLVNKGVSIGKSSDILRDVKGIKNVNSLTKNLFGKGSAKFSNSFFRIANKKNNKRIIKEAIGSIPKLGAKGGLGPIGVIVGAVLISLIISSTDFSISSINLSSAGDTLDTEIRRQDSQIISAMQDAVDFMWGYHRAFEMNVCLCKDSSKGFDTDETKTLTAEIEDHDPTATRLTWTLGIPDTWAEQMHDEHYYAKGNAANKVLDVGGKCTRFDNTHIGKCISSATKSSDAYAEKKSSQREPDKSSGYPYGKYAEIEDAELGTPVYDENGELKGFQLKHYWGPSVCKYTGIVEPATVIVPETDSKGNPIPNTKKFASGSAAFTVYAMGGLGIDCGGNGDAEEWRLNYKDTKEQKYLRGIGDDPYSWTPITSSMIKQTCPAKSTLKTKENQEVTVNFIYQGSNKTYTYTEQKTTLYHTSGLEMTNSYKKEGEGIDMVSPGNGQSVVYDVENFYKAFCSMLNAINDNSVGIEYEEGKEYQSIQNERWNHVFMKRLFNEVMGGTHINPNTGEVEPNCMVYLKTIFEEEPEYLVNFDTWEDGGLHLEGHAKDVKGFKPHVFLDVYIRSSGIEDLINLESGHKWTGENDDPDYPLTDNFWVRGLTMNANPKTKMDIIEHKQFPLTIRSYSTSYGDKNGEGFPYGDDKYYQWEGWFNNSRNYLKKPTASLFYNSMIENSKSDEKPTQAHYWAHYLYEMYMPDFLKYFNNLKLPHKATGEPSEEGDDGFKLDTIEWDNKEYKKDDEKWSDLANPPESIKMSKKLKEELAKYFPNGIPQTKEEMMKYMTTVSVQILGKDGTLKSKNITVHKDVAASLQKAVNELTASGFPIYDIAGFNYRNVRGGNSLSQHAYGLAIDINPNENAMVKNGKVVAGSLWNPNSNEYSISQEQANIFIKNGWDWGGNWNSSKDYMHFSVTGW